MGIVASDDYPTPQDLADAICIWLHEILPHKKVFVEPSCGAGTFIKAVKRAWPNPERLAFLGVDIQGKYRSAVERLGHPFAEGDFLELVTSSGMREWLTGPDCLVPGNPPYSDDLPMKFIQAILDHSAPGTHTAFLLRQSFEGSMTRALEFPGRSSLRWKRAIAGRPKFNTASKNQDNSEYAVFVYETGYDGHYTGWRDPLVWKPEHVRRLVPTG